MSQDNLQISVSGICCGNSIVRAQKVIKAIEGVSKVRIDLANNLAHISGNPSPHAVVKALIEAGFPSAYEEAG